MPERRVREQAHADDAGRVAVERADGDGLAARAVVRAVFGLDPDVGQKTRKQRLMDHRIPAYVDVIGQSRVPLPSCFTELGYQLIVDVAPFAQA